MDTIKVCYPANVMEQRNLPGFKPTKKSDFIVITNSEGHFLYHSQYLCGDTDAGILADNNASKIIQFNYALLGHPICKKCESKYKAKAGGPWEKWVGVPRSATQEEIK